jgi:hypothetical protein
MAVFQGELKHLGGRVHAIKFKTVFEWQEIGSMGAAKVNQFALLPALGHYFQLLTEDRPVPEAVPPRCYLVEDIFLAICQWIIPYILNLIKLKLLIKPKPARLIIFLWGVYNEETGQDNIRGNPSSGDDHAY